MKIAVTMRSVLDQATGERRDCISRDVVALVERLGAIPMLVPNGLRDVMTLMRGTAVDALLLTGGNDLCDMDAGAHSKRHPADALRDHTEGMLLRYATDAQLGVFGICRGMQLIARFFGGAIECIEPGGAHVNTQHAVELAAGPLHELIDEDNLKRLMRQPMMTNSFHNFGVRASALPSELVALATSHDGYVEALKHRTLPIAGVSWHPERAGSAAALDALLLRAWLDSCSAAAARA
jgi:gamma-glutamyl-gamma-aminobutyrate hydrolase PuuD